MTVTKVVGFDLWITKHFSLHFYDFFTILYGIYNFAVFETKEKENELLHLGPWKFVSSQGRSLADGSEQGRGGAWFSGDSLCRRRGIGGGEARGARAAPMGGLGERGGARKRQLDGAGRPAAALPRRGGAPVTGGRGGLSQEIRREVGVPFPGLVGAERGRRVGLRGRAAAVVWGLWAGS